jgi:hypothetical protein
MHGQSIRKDHLECFRNMVYFGLMILQDGRDALSMVISVSFSYGSPRLLPESSRECVDDEMLSQWESRFCISTAAQIPASGFLNLCR